MTRLKPGLPPDNLVNKKIQCQGSQKECTGIATIWIRRGAYDDLFLCDTCAFHLARILMQDIGHVKVRPEEDPWTPSDIEQIKEQMVFLIDLVKETHDDIWNQLIRKKQNE